eukprot:PLAT8591.1.p1 GENE.PLAT8591.1~~PLAT8591.1.p1  ORF type:complete len:738 (+),score=309.97 PLAT8591.1:37-2250(+)
MKPMRVKTTRRAGGKGKKMVIKPFKVKPKLPADFEERTWAELLTAVRAVHSKLPISASREELYRSVKDLCIHKMAAGLYSKLQAVCDEHIGAQLEALEGQTPEHVAFLMLVEGTWKEHCEAMTLVRQIFLYLDRTYVIQSADVAVRSLFDMGLALFRKHLQAHVEVAAKLLAGMLHLVQRERTGEAVNRTLLRSLTRMYHSLNLYSAAFAQPLVDASRAFYAEEGVRLMSELPPPTYLAHVQQRLAEENERVTRYLDASSRAPLIAVVEDELLRRHTSELLERGFGELIDGIRLPDLTRLYALCARVDALEEMKAAWSSHIRTTGLALVKDTEREKAKTLVPQLLDFRLRLRTILTDAFGNDDAFGYSTKSAMEAVVSSRDAVLAALIAKFIDSQLRSGNKSGTEEEVEALLDRSMELFRFLGAKDMAEAHFKKDFAKRLLLSRSASRELEMSFISKLKAECGGGGTTAHLEGMLKDIDLSRDVLTQFNESAAAGSVRMDLHVQVLTSGFWPHYNSCELKLPAHMASALSAFKTFYLQLHRGRTLTWQHTLGTCVLKARFPRGRKELAVSLFQAVVLLTFNEADTLSYEEIVAATGMEEKELKRTLLSLACGKVRVLRKEPKSRSVAADDVFHFNAALKQKLFRLKISSIQGKETAEERRKTKERVFRERQYAVDAAIVRIMKTRKRLAHAVLLSELFEQLRFPASPADLKRRIGSLIDREYLERDEDDPSVYVYLA